MMSASMPFVSVIIPTFNRSSSLTLCLRSLAAQRYPEGRWEVIVVDDGSSDDTGAVLGSFQDGRLPLRSLRHADRRGSGPARNTGLADTRADIVVFLDSDVVATPWLVSEHARSHAACRCFADGPAITVDGAGDPRPLLDARWIRLLAALDLGGARFVTANVSCRRADVVAAGGFDEAFGARYGWEDTELGVRLAALGVRRVKNRRAYVLHRHVSGYDWRERGRKEEQAGVNAAYFLAKHPTREVARLIRGRPRLARALGACGLDAERVARACSRHASRSPLAWALGECHAILQYERGLRSGASREPERLSPEP